MADDDWREALEAALDAGPDDQRARRELAERLAALGDADAEPLRWLAETARRPFDGGGMGRWCWARGPGYSPGTRSVISGPVWDRLAAPANVTGTDKVYRSRRDAEQDFCRAWHAARAAGWDATLE
jgi:hypothetical protein